MLRILFSFVFLLATNSSAADQLPEKRTEFQSENLFEIMAYGSGVSEAITDLGKSSYSKISGVGHGEEYSFSVLTEAVKGITKKVVIKDSGEEIPLELEVTKENFNIPFGGTLSALTLESAISSFGQPDERSVNELKYLVPGHIEDQILIITFENEKAKSIKWVWWEI